MHIAFHRLATIAAIVAFCVIVLGAFVRLSDAGLGCPDWPGCYGQYSWPVGGSRSGRSQPGFSRATRGE